MAVTNEVFLIVIQFLIYLVIGINWEFTLFNAKAKDDSNQNNAAKSLIIWLLIWLQPLITQLALEYAGDYGRSADIIKLLETTYAVNIWIGITISIYFGIFFVYNVAMFLAAKGGEMGK